MGKHYPPFAVIIKGDDPERLLEVHRSLRSIASSMAIFLLAAVAVYLVNFFFGDFRFDPDIPILNRLSTRWLAVIPILMLLEILRKTHDDLYIFAASRLTEFKGRLSLSSKRPSIKYTDILSMSVKQDIFGRLFNYGDVLLDTAGESGVEMTVGGVLAPRELLVLIEEFRINSILQEMAESQSNRRGPGPIAAAG